MANNREPVVVKPPKQAPEPPRPFDSFPPTIEIDGEVLTLLESEDRPEKVHALVRYGYPEGPSYLIAEVSVALHRMTAEAARHWLISRFRGKLGPRRPPPPVSPVPQRGDVLSPAPAERNK